MTSNYSTWCEEHLHKVRIAGGWAEARCPLHEDHKPSLRVDVESGGYKCNSGSCPHPTGHLHQLAERAGLSKVGLPEKKQGSSLEMQAEYLYPTADRKPFGKVLRFWDSSSADKTFRQMTWRGGKWAYGKDGKFFPIYRAPQIAAAPAASIILWLEGEKCVEQAVKMGFEATTSAQGAKSFESCDKASLHLLAGHKVYVLPDNDKAGRDYANQVATALAGIAAEVHLVDLPGLLEKGDLVDWVQAGGTAEALRGILGDSHSVGIRGVESRLCDNENPLLLDSTLSPPGDCDEWGDPEPFDRPTKPQFPVYEVLTGKLQEYCLAVAELSQTSPEMAFFSMVGVASTCIQKQVKVQSGPSRYLPTNIWAAGVAASGSGKTVVLDEVQRPFSEYEMELRESIEARNAESAQERKQVEADIEKLQATKDRTVDQDQELSCLRARAGDLAEIPVPDLFITDPTSESLEDLLASNQGRLGVLNAEAGDYLGILAGRYSKAGGASIKPLLSSYSGETWKTSRVIRGRRHIVNPASTQVLFVQPTVIQDLVGWKDFTQRGFLARFFLIWPDELPNPKNIWDRAPIRSALKDSWGSIVRSLASLKAPVDQRGEPDAYRVELTLQARNASYHFWDWVRQETQRNGTLGGIRDFGNRLAENVNRLAGVLHVLECLAEDKTPWEYCISGETYERAIKVGKWSVGHALQVYAANVSANSDNPDAWKVWSVIRGMDNPVVINARDVYHRLDHNPRFRSASVVKSTLEVLESMGYVRRFQESPNKGGGRPKTLYEVNPKALSPLLSENPVQKVQNPPNPFAEGILERAKTEAKTPFGPAKTPPGMSFDLVSPEVTAEYEEFTLK